MEPVEIVVSVMLLGVATILSILGFITRKTVNDLTKLTVSDAANKTLIKDLNKSHEQLYKIVHEEQKKLNKTINILIEVCARIGIDYPHD